MYYFQYKPTNILIPLLVKKVIKEAFHSFERSELQAHEVKPMGYVADVEMPHSNLINENFFFSFMQNIEKVSSAVLLLLFSFFWK